MWLNETIARLAPDLVHRANILHLTGKGETLASGRGGWVHRS